MPDPAIAQVEDALAAQLGAYAALADYTVRTDGSKDIAIDPAEAAQVINIYTVAYAVDQADELNQTIHAATIEAEVISATPTIGTISRQVHTAIAHIIAAIAADRTLGIGLQDIQEIDVAPSGANGKDVGTASLQLRVLFFTSRDDWFTIL